MKHIELFKDGFNDTINEKIKPENYPYIGLDMVTGEFSYTEVPEPVVGPADNEIWYTTSDGTTITPHYYNFGSDFVETVYEDGKGILRFNGPITYIPGEHTGGIWQPAGAFNSCEELTTITIPNSVTNIGTQAFIFCSSLTSITFYGTIEEWNNITKGSGWNDYVPATYVQCTDGQVEL